MGAEEPQRRTLADRLDYLMRTVHPPGRGEYTHEEVAAEIAAQGGPTISGSYIWQLRTGRKDNPTKKHIEALARFFGVSPLYFFDDTEAERVEAELALLAAMRDQGIRRLALRSSGLRPESLEAITSMVEQARRLQGLSNGEGRKRDKGQ